MKLKDLLNKQNKYNKDFDNLKIVFYDKCECTPIFSVNAINLYNILLNKAEDDTIDVVSYFFTEVSIYKEKYNSKDNILFVYVR